jgi:trimethylamine--corrinoid protein Co-methyltransferase
LIYTYSKKPGSTYILTPISARYITQMASTVGQSVGYLLETVSPLQFRKESLEMAMVFAKAGQYLYMGPMVIGGASGPVTVAGTVTLQNAEILASIFMIYALTGKLTWYGAGTHTMDMRTMLCSFGSPNQALIGICTGQMGRFYGLANGNNTGLTDSLQPDFQGGFEKAASAILGMFAGNSNIGCQGFVGADQCFSMEQLAIDNEWIDAFNYIVRGVEVNEDTIAADLIEQVGIAGSFMSEEHTAEYLRENYWPTKLFNRDNMDKWVMDGSKSLYTRAHEFVEDITAGYRKKNPVITASQAEELEYLARCAGKEAKERG